MGCSVTYKGRKYSMDEFKFHVENNYQEFSEYLLPPTGLPEEDLIPFNYTREREVMDPAVVVADQDIRVNDDRSSALFIENYTKKAKIIKLPNPENVDAINMLNKVEDVDVRKNNPKLMVDGDVFDDTKSDKSSLIITHKMKGTTWKGRLPKSLHTRKIKDRKSKVFVKAGDNIAFKTYYPYLDYSKKFKIGGKTYYFLTDKYEYVRGSEKIIREERERRRVAATQLSRYGIKPSKKANLSPRFKAAMASYLETYKEAVQFNKDLVDTKMKEMDLEASHNVVYYEDLLKTFSVDRNDYDDPQTRKLAINRIVAEALRVEPRYVDAAIRKVLEKLPTVVLVNMSIQNVSTGRIIYDRVNLYQKLPEHEGLPDDPVFKFSPNVNTVIPTKLTYIDPRGGTKTIDIQPFIDEVNEEIYSGKFSKTFTAVEEYAFTSMGKKVPPTRSKGLAVLAKVYEKYGVYTAKLFSTAYMEKVGRVVDTLKYKYYEANPGQQEKLNELHQVTGKLYGMLNSAKYELRNMIPYDVTSKAFNVDVPILETEKYSLKMPNFFYTNETDFLSKQLGDDANGSYTYYTGTNMEILTNEQAQDLWDNSRQGYREAEEITKGIAGWVYDMAAYSVDLHIFNEIVNKINVGGAFDQMHPKDKFIFLYEDLILGKGVYAEALKNRPSDDIIGMIVGAIINVVRFILGQPSTFDVLKHELDQIHNYIKAINTVQARTDHEVRIINDIGDSTIVAMAEDYLTHAINAQMSPRAIKSHHHYYQNHFETSAERLPEGLNINVGEFSAPNLKEFPVDIEFSHRLVKFHAPGISIDELPPELGQYIRDQVAVAVLKDFEVNRRQQVSGQVDSMVVRKSRSKLMSRVKPKYSFDHHATLSYNEAALPMYTMGAPGKKYNVEIGAFDSAPFPKRLYEIFRFHHGYSQLKIDNALGWIGGQIDEDGGVMYITEVQSDIMQRTFEMYTTEGRATIAKKRNQQDRPPLSYITSSAKMDELLKDTPNLKTQLENYYDGWLHVFTGSALNLVFRNNPNLTEVRIPSSAYYKTLHPNAPYQYYDNIASAFPDAQLSGDGNWWIVQKSQIFGQASDSTKDYYDVIIKAGIDAGVIEQKKITPDLASDQEIARDILETLKGMDLLALYLESESGQKHLEDIEQWIQATYSAEKPMTDDTKGGELVGPDGEPIEDDLNDEFGDLITKAFELEAAQELEKNIQESLKKPEKIKFRLDFYLSELQQAIKDKNKNRENFVRNILEEFTNREDVEYIYDETSISDLEEGLKEASTDKAKFDTQIERLSAQSNKLSNILKQIKDDNIKKRLRDGIKYIREDKEKLSNFVYFLLEANAALKFYAEDLKKIVNKPIEEAVVELDNALVVSNAFTDTITFLKKDFRYTDSNNAFKKLVDDLSSHYEQIHNIYAAEAEVLAFKFISEELSEDARIAYKTLKDQLDKLEAELIDAKRIGSSPGYIKTIEGRIESAKKDIIALVPNAQTIEDVFRGLRGDLNWFSGNFRSTLALGDPVLSGYARRLKRGYNRVRARMTPIRNIAQDRVDNYISKSGHTPRESMERFYEGMYALTKQELYNDKGELETEEFYSLLGPVEQKFYNENSKYQNDIRVAKKSGDLREVEKAQKLYSDWLSKYAERKYKAEWYDRYKLLTPEAYDARQKIYEEINRIQRHAGGDQLTEADYERVATLKHELRGLSSTYYNGVKKTGEALAIAESIQAFNKETNRMATWEVTDLNRHWFEVIVNAKKKQVEDGMITQKIYDQWFANNTHRVISPEFYAARQVIIDKIQKITSKLPKQVFTQDIKELWATILDVSKPHRDEDNIVVGSQFEAPESSVIRSAEEQIEELRAKIVRFSGLTMAEQEEKQGLEGTDVLNPNEMSRLMYLRDKSDEYKNYLGNYVTQNEILTLFAAFGELAAISKFETTTYYNDTYQAKLHEFRANYDPAEVMEMTEVIEAFKEEDQWYKDNHVRKTKAQYENGKTFYIDVDEPLYIWKDIIPTNKEWVLEDQPGFAFKTRVVHSDFINSTYESLNNEYFRVVEQDDFRTVPKRIVDGKLSPYMSEPYESLRRGSTEADVAKMSLLQYLTDVHLLGQQELPKYKRLGYALPGVRKGFYDRAVEQGVKGVKNHILDTTWRVTEEDRDLILGDVSQIDLSIIPVKFSTKVKPEDQSLDLTSIILKHRMGVEEYAYLEEELPYAKVVQSALKTAPSDVSDTMISRVLDLFDKKKFIKGTKASQRFKTFDSFLRTMFYGESEVSPFNSDTWNKRLGSVFGLATLQVMVLNYPAHITNILSGEVQNVIESVGGKYMTMKDYARAKSIYMSAVPDFWEDYTKEGHKTFWTALAEKLDVPQGEYIDNMGNKATYSRLRDIKSHLMFMKQMGEHEIQVSAMIAMAINKKVKLNGVAVSLKDALELRDGDIRIKAGVTTMQGEEFTEKNLNVFQDQVHAVVRQLNGAYSKIDKTVAEKSFLGKLAFYMRKYFIPMAYRRFEPYKYDYEERAFKEGYYLTGWRMIKDLVRMNTSLIENWDRYKNLLTEDEKRNVRRFMTELAIIGLLWLSIMLIGGYGDDRDLKGRWLYTMALYQLMKVKSETETFIPFPKFGFEELTTLFSSPFVPATTAKTGGRVLKDILNIATFNDDAYFKRDYGIWQEGDLRITADALKLVGLNPNILSPENLVKNFELRNR